MAFSAPVIAESLRDPTCTGLNRVYINLHSPQSMVEDHKKNESESESEEYMALEYWRRSCAYKDNLIDELEKRIMALEKLETRILALEKVMMSFTYNSEMGSGHPDDGGWFD